MKKLSSLLNYLMILGIYMVLPACITVSPQDRAPLKDVDVSKIPNAIPKAEPKSRFGNPNSYSVFGKYYHVLPNNHGYSEVGIASWYGMKFHKEQTSSGEYYDLYQMTAAHKTLPIPSYVKVTNLRNGRMIIVKVNDRGPFEQNRLIDLSYVAAKKLDILKKGTGLVRVESIEPLLESKPTTYQKWFKATEQPPTQKIYMQLGIYSDLKKAQSELQRAQQVTSLPVQLETIPTSNTTRYRLKLGPFVDQEIARRFAEFMEHSGFTNFIMKG